MALPGHVRAGECFAWRRTLTGRTCCQPSFCATSSWPGTYRFSQQLKVTGGSGTGYTYKATTLPKGLTLSTTGLLSGTPTVAGTSTIAITVTDSNKGTATMSYTLVVNA
jgi:hypothetical protein